MNYVNPLNEPLNPLNPLNRATTLSIVALTLLGFITHGTYAGRGDEPHYLAIAHSIAFDCDFDLANNYGANEPLSAAAVLQSETTSDPVWTGPRGRSMTSACRCSSRPWSRLRSGDGRRCPGSPGAPMRRAKLTPTVLYRQLLSVAMIAVTVWMACCSMPAARSAYRRARLLRRRACGVVSTAAGAFGAVLHRTAIRRARAVRLPRRGPHAVAVVARLAASLAWRWACSS